MTTKIDAQTKIELLKIAATLTTVKFKDGDDLAVVFADCYEIASAEFKKSAPSSGVVPVVGTPRTNFG